MHLCVIGSVLQHMYFLKGIQAVSLIGTLGAFIPSLLFLKMWTVISLELTKCHIQNVRQLPIQTLCWINHANQNNLKTPLQVRRLLPDIYIINKEKRNYKFTPIPKKFKVRWSFFTFQLIYEAVGWLSKTLHLRVG